MTVDEIKVRLSEIGPHVNYRTSEVNGQTLHQFTVSEKPFGHLSTYKSAHLAFLGDLADVELSDEFMEEGRRRYTVAA